jgi:hypothetical protein
MFKHLGIAGLLVTLGACTYTVAAHVVPNFAKGYRADTGRPAAQARAVALAADMVSNYAAALASARVTAAGAEPIALEAFGYRAPPPARKRFARPQPLPEVKLGLVYEAGGERIALIDSKLYTEGDTLPTGERVEQVATDRIVLHGGQGTREVALDTTRAYLRGPRASQGPRSALPPMQFRIPVSNDGLRKPGNAPMIADDGVIDILVSREAP